MTTKNHSTKDTESASEWELRFNEQCAGGNVQFDKRYMSFASPLPPASPLHRTSMEKGYIHLDCWQRYEFWIIYAIYNSKTHIFFYYIYQSKLKFYKNQNPDGWRSLSLSINFWWRGREMSVCDWQREGEVFIFNSFFPNLLNFYSKNVIDSTRFLW